MNKRLPLALLLAAAASYPALAEPAADKAGAGSAVTMPEGNPFTQENAREHLIRQGYTNVSELTKDESGRWVGTAVKDGKTVPVAVDVKGGPNGQ